MKYDIQESKRKQVSVNLSPEVEEYVRERALKENRSFSSMIQFIIIENMVEHNKVK